MPGARMRRRKKAREERAKEEAQGRDEPVLGCDGKLSLFDDDVGDDGEEELRVNEKYKKRFEHNEGLKDQMRLRELTHELGVDGDEESSSEEEDSDAEMLTEEVNQNILETLVKIRSKDPAIYKSDVKFFQEEEEEKKEEEGGDGKDGQKKKKAKKLTVVDMERERILRGDTGEHEDSDTAAEDAEPGANEGYFETQKRVKDAFKRAAADSSDDDLFVPRSRSKVDKDKEDKEFSEFMKDRLAEQARDSSATLRSLLNDPAMDEDEKFLRDYILGNQWKDEHDRERQLRDNPMYADVVGRGSDGELSEDEAMVVAAEDFEQQYNFRFEQEGADAIVGHARKVESSVRREESKRKEQRKRKQERQASVLEQKKLELKRLKGAKKGEILKRLATIQKVSGAPSIDADKVALEDDFDPAEHDAKMAELFGDDYYDDGGDLVHPFAEGGDDDAALLDALNYDYGEEEVEEHEGGEEAGSSKKKQNKKLSAKERREMAREEKRRAKEMEAGGEEAGGAGARRGWSISEHELESEAQAAGGEGQDLLDDYYQLDFEDLIGDTPTRFKYGRGEAIDFGLTAEEMLLLDDKDLKQIIPMSVVTAPHKYLAPAKLKAIRKKARKLLEEMGLRPREGEEEGEQKRRRHEEGGGGWEEEDEEGKRKRKRSKGKELGGEREEAEEDRKKHKHTHKHKHDGDWGNRRQKRERGGKGEREERRRSKRTDEMEREDAGGGVGVDSDRLASYGIKPVKPTQHASRHNSKRAGSGHTSRNQRTHAVAPAAPESSPSAATRHPQRGAHHVEQASDEHRTTRDPPRSAGNKGKEGTVEREGKQGAKADNEGKAALPHEARRSKIEEYKQRLDKHAGKHKEAKQHKDKARNLLDDQAPDASRDDPMHGGFKRKHMGKRIAFDSDDDEE